MTKLSLNENILDHPNRKRRAGAGNMTRGVINDKWSMRVLWLCAIGSAVSLYMVAAERQAQNRDRALAESLNAAESQGSGENV